MATHLDRSPRLRFRLATLDDLGFIDRLRKRDSAALGFLSRTALAEKIRLGWVLLAEPCAVDVTWSERSRPSDDSKPKVDHRPCGFLLHGSLRQPEVRVFQLAVEPAWRGRGVAGRLLRELLRRGRRAGAAGVSLRCREELPANRFWHRSRFTLHDLEPGRRGALYVWVRRLGGRPGSQDGPAKLPFHTRWHACPDCGRWTCGSWTRRGVRRGVCQGCLSLALKRSEANPPALNSRQRRSTLCRNEVKPTPQPAADGDHDLRGHCAKTK